MLKLLLLLVGLGAGAGGAVAWLLVQPGEEGYGAPPSPSGRVQELKTRFAAAVQEGKRSGAETETRLRERLDAQRAQATRSRTA